MGVMVDRLVAFKVERFIIIWMASHGYHFPLPTRTYMGAGGRGEAGHRHHQPREALPRHHGLRVTRREDGGVPEDGRLCFCVCV